MKNLKIFITAIAVTATMVIYINTDKIKDNLSWIFEADESQIALPDLSNREIEEAANKNKYGDFGKKIPSPVISKELNKETE